MVAVVNVPRVRRFPYRPITQPRRISQQEVDQAEWIGAHTVDTSKPITASFYNAQPVEKWGVTTYQWPPFILGAS
jgi:hypothetical protein